MSLAEEGHVVTTSGIGQFLKRYRETGTIARRLGTGSSSKRTDDILKKIDEQMEENDETTLEELRLQLEKEGINVSVSSIHRWRQDLGWTTKGTKYCQLIRDANVEKRLDWAVKNVDDIYLDNLVFTDETTVQLENHRRTTCYKKGRKPRYKPRPKHPVKVHVWGGISARGCTGVCIFDGKMNAALFMQILDRTLLPFIREVYPDGCMLVQDNDPKHSSKAARSYYTEQDVDWWKTPAESPDLNPIECLWHELKHFIRAKVKPKTKRELIDGINLFWDSIDVAKCQKYVYHLKKVIPEVIHCEGRATGY